MKIYLTVTLFIASLSLVAQDIVESNAFFLAVNGTNTQLAYLKPTVVDTAGVVIGKIVIHDIQKKTSSPFNDNEYSRDNLVAAWSSDDQRFFVSDGTSVVMFVEHKQTMKQLFKKVMDEDLITTFRTSQDGKRVAVSVREVRRDKVFQAVYLVNTENGELEKIYSVLDLVDKSRGSNVSFLNAKTTFVHDVNKNLFEIPWDKKKQRQRIDRADRTLYADEGSVYYQKDNSLMKYSIKDKTHIAIFSAQNLKANYVNKYTEGNVIVSLNESFFMVDNTGSFKKLNLKPGNYQIVNDQIAIKQDADNIFLLSFIH